MKSHIEGLFASGCSFVSPFGSTGEGASFSVREKRAALTALQHAGVPMERLLPASMSPALDDAVESIGLGVSLGCRAVLVAPPFYYGGASQAGIAAFFATCAERLGGTLPIDIVLYHIPALTRIPYGVELVRTLMREHGSRIVAIKDSTGDREHTLMLQQTFPELRIFTGDDRVLPDLLDAGGAGMIGGMPNVVADDLCAFYRDRHGPQAATSRDRARQRIEAVDVHGGISALKALKARISDDPAWALPLPPLSPLDAPGTAQLLGSFRQSEFPFPPGSD